MKKIFSLLMALVFVVAFGSMAYAQESTAANNTAARSNNIAETLKASQLMGMRVENDQGQDLGTISNLGIDPSTEKVDFAVIQHGGFWGFESKYVPVPLSAMTLKTNGKGKPEVFILNMSKEELAKAPSFSGGAWPNRTEIAQSERFFGQSPAWGDHGRSTAGSGPVSNNMNETR